MTELEFIKKESFKKELQKLAAHPAAYMGIGAGLIGAGLAAEVGINKYMDNKIKEQSDVVFEDIYKNTPELKKYPKNEVRLYFDSIVHHSPRIATDPVAAKAFLLQMLPWSESGGVPVDNFVNLAQITSKNDYVPLKMGRMGAGLHGSLSSAPLKAVQVLG